MSTLFFFNYSLLIKNNLFIILCAFYFLYIKLPISSFILYTIINAERKDENIILKFTQKQNIIEEKITTHTKLQNSKINIKKHRYHNCTQTIE